MSASFRTELCSRAASSAAAAVDSRASSTCSTSSSACGASASRTPTTMPASTIGYARDVAVVGRPGIGGHVGDQGRGDQGRRRDGAVRVAAAAGGEEVAVVAAHPQRCPRAEQVGGGRRDRLGDVARAQAGRGLPCHPHHGLEADGQQGQPGLPGRRLRRPAGGRLPARRGRRSWRPARRPRWRRTGRQVAGAQRADGASRRASGPATVRVSRRPRRSARRPATASTARPRASAATRATC